jgi:hypothetical protein
MYKVNLATKCNTCKQQGHVEVNYVDVLKYQQGQLIQKCFPYLSDDQRELLISNTCSACWDKMFAEDEEDMVPDYPWDIPTDNLGEHVMRVTLPVLAGSRELANLVVLERFDENPDQRDDDYDDWVMSEAQIEEYFANK